MEGCEAMMLVGFGARRRCGQPETNGIHHSGRGPWAHPYQPPAPTTRPAPQVSSAAGGVAGDDRFCCRACGSRPRRGALLTYVVRVGWVCCGHPDLEELDCG